MATEIRSWNTSASGRMQWRKEQRGTARSLVPSGDIGTVLAVVEGMNANTAATMNPETAWKRIKFGIGFCVVAIIVIQIAQG